GGCAISAGQFGANGLKRVNRAPVRGNRFVWLTQLFHEAAGLPMPLKQRLWGDNQLGGENCPSRQIQGFLILQLRFVERRKVSQGVRVSQGISDLFRHGSRHIEGLESLLEEL